MLQTIEKSRISIGRAGIVMGLVMGMGASFQALAQEATTSKPTSTRERLLLESMDRKQKADRSSTAAPAAASDATPSAAADVPAATATSTKPAGSAKSSLTETPSFEQLDSAATNLNDALSGARAKLDELRQATELAAMAAELREELESSIQENNRLAATLGEVQSERTQLETQHNLAQREIIELTQSADAAKLEIAEQRQKLEQRDCRIAEIDEARIESQKQIQSLELDLDKASGEIGDLSGEIAELTGQLETTRTDLDKANETAKHARDDRDEANQELSKVRKQIAGMLRSVLLGGEPIDVSALEEAEAKEREARQAVSQQTARYEAVRASNVRAEPNPDSRRVGFAKRGDFITVIGKVDGRNWFEVETNEGVRGFIFGDLIRPAA